MSVHGYNAYTHGCRCPTCRQAKADYQRARRAAGRDMAQAHTHIPGGGRPNKSIAFAPGAVRHVARGVTHGTRSAYDERGCRCLPCTEARSRADRRWKGRSS